MTQAKYDYVPALGGYWADSELSAIDNTLRVAGSATSSAVPWTGFRFTPGTGYEFIAPPVPGCDVITADMNENGVVVGHTWANGNQSVPLRAFRWTGPSGLLLLGPATEDAEAKGINKYNYVAGVAGQAPAFWLPNGTRVFLPRLLVAYFDQAAMERRRDLTSATTQLVLVADFGDGTYQRGADRVAVR